MEVCALITADLIPYESPFLFACTVVVSRSQGSIVVGTVQIYDKEPVTAPKSMQSKDYIVSCKCLWQGCWHISSL